MEFAPSIIQCGTELWEAGNRYTKGVGRLTERRKPQKRG